MNDNPFAPTSEAATVAQGHQEEMPLEALFRISTRYAGIGSRSTPRPILFLIGEIAGMLADYGLTLRSGGAIKTGSNTAIATYTRDEAGRVTKRALANGLETVYTWDDANRPTKIVLRETATPANIVQSFEYGYDSVGNRLWTKAKDGKGDVYKYDSTYQVTGVKYEVDDPTVGYDLATSPARTVTYAYDAIGNRTSVTEDGTPTTYTTNNLNQYTVVGGSSYTYSSRGDLAGDGTWTYGYDPQGRLISATKTGTTVAYRYDSGGRRIEKNVNGTITKYVYNGYDLIEERDASNNATAVYYYEKGIDRPVKVLKGTTEYYFQQDALGNIVGLTDDTGAIVEQYSYDVFGKPTIRDGAGALVSIALTPFLFTGREYDVETELYHYRARAYSPQLGRFLQPDPINFEAGDLNLHCYVFNSPINFTDPYGLCWYDDFLDWVRQYSSIDVTVTGGLGWGGSFTASFSGSGATVFIIGGKGFGLGGSVAAMTSTGSPNGWTAQAVTTGGAPWGAGAASVSVSSGGGLDASAGVGIGLGAGVAAGGGYSWTGTWR